MTPLAEERLDGRIALVTGAARRVGRAVALELGRAGAQVLVHCRASRADADATAAELRALGADAAVLAADLTDAAATTALFAAVAARGGLDILVNNAAVYERTPFEQIDDARLAAMLDANFVAPFRCARLAVPLLRARGGGTIVNLLDVAATQAWPDHAHYCAAKAALHMLTRCLAVELAPAIRVVGVSPGTVALPAGTSAAEAARIIGKIPARRAGTPEDVARAVRFLCAGPAFITGTILPVDGGRSAAGPAVGV
ncbi:MAG TPA: SDR family oxidoreductase [Polyangia bacterium]|jgi:NAD(P)-dependent dehydrogenase (short-subunit alcohol dehydrogenase family)